MTQALAREPQAPGRLGVEVLGAAALVGVGLAAVAWQWQRAARRPLADAHRRALIVYLREHLAGSDAAIRVVERLRLSQAGTREGRLFGSLYDEFREERDVVRALIAGLGASPLTPARVATSGAGRALASAAGGESGDLSLFHTLEGLAIGVHGKRCLWRALSVLIPDDAVPGRRTLAGLEAMALRQWEDIEQRRQAVAVEAFGGLELPAVEPAID